MQRKEDVIRLLVLREAVKLPSPQDTEGTQELVQYLTRVDTRNIIFHCGLKIAEEDPQRSTSIALFLMNYVPSFPPSQDMLLQIRSWCQKGTRENTSSAAVINELKEIVDGYISNRALDYLMKDNVMPVVRNPFSFKQELSQTPDYVNKFQLQSLVENTEKGVTPIPLSLWTNTEVTVTSTEKNSTQNYTKEVTYTFYGCKEYIKQFPLECSEDVVKQQVNVLFNFWDNYRSNPAVHKATTFMIKQMCDGYVSKIPFGEPYTLFRSISVCYLPTLFGMMESDYLCVRSHVYDFLLTLGVHMQIVDPQGVYPGCTAALQCELVWMLLNVLKRQAVLKTQDEMIWTAAVKCVLVVMPREYRHLIDSRALLHFLQVEKLAELHPDLFGILAEAFSRSLLQDKRIGVKPQENLVLDKEALTSLGNSAITQILILYRKAMTVGGRLAFFHFMFAFAAHRVGSSSQGGGGGDPNGNNMNNNNNNNNNNSSISPQPLQHTFQLLVSLEFFWYLHPLLFYQSHRALRELPTQIIYDLDSKELLEHRTMVVTMVQEVLRIIEEDATIPDMIMRRFWELKQNSKESIDTLIEISNDVITAVPLLLKDSSSTPRMYNLAWRLSFYSLRTIREHLDPAVYEEVSRRMMKNIVDYDGSNHDAVLKRTRSVYCNMIYSAALLGRTQPKQGVDIIQKMLEAFFFFKAGPPANAVVQLMTLYNHTIEFMVCRAGPIADAPEMSDITELLFSERLYVPYSSAAGFGYRVLWGIYRGLTADNTLAVCRARYVLVSLIAKLSEKVNENSIRGWKTVMADPYPQVALVGAQCVVNIYKKEYGDRVVDPFIKRVNLYKAAIKLIENHEKLGKPKKK